MRLVDAVFITGAISTDSLKDTASLETRQRTVLRSLPDRGQFIK